MSSTATTLAKPRHKTVPSERGLSSLRIWLGVLAALIVAMILVGGATRLTESGLSITEWKPVLGAIPPLSGADWQEAFDAYKQIPQYAEINRGMSLDRFKTIYWWEWTHRSFGRLIGVVFLVPFVAFWLAGAIPRALLPRLLLLFALGALQGAVGWYMVMSGLIDRVSVSQYRLTVHFGLALFILGYTLWLLFGLGGERQARGNTQARSKVSLAGGVLALIFLQMLAGALVAGMDAGLGYNTWPLIDGAFIPSGLGEAQPWYLNLFENPLTVQFNHRMLGYAVVIAALAQFFWLGLRRGPPPSLGSALTVALLAVLQAVLGVWTLLLAVPITLGLAHQAGAVALFAVALYHFWLARTGAAEGTGAQAAASA